MHFNKIDIHYSMYFCDYVCYSELNLQQTHMLTLTIQAGLYYLKIIVYILKDYFDSIPLDPYIINYWKYR